MAGSPDRPGHLGSGARARIVFGTVALSGGPPAHTLLDRFRGAGGRALDLANSYEDGEAARAVGGWLAGRRLAGELTLYVKGCHPPTCRPELVGPEVERALRLLRVERLDVFLLHRDDPGFPVAAWAQALHAEVAAGRVGAVGVSNWTLVRTRELARALPAGELAAFSNHFSLADMLEAPWPGCLAVSRPGLCELAGMRVDVLAWSSLALGYFAGRESPSWSSPANAARRERARALASERGVSTTAIALAYVLHAGAHVLPVVRTGSAAHLDELMAAAELELSPAELEWLEAGAAI
ncbi:MAG TPA: aldo/keto reductase [Solirubrobacteraceae bacterium]|nr:aldo/keto reductase [Solirubrobacteraceae bacterium]